MNMKRIIGSAIAFAAVFLTFGSTAATLAEGFAGTPRFVSKSGNDQNDGLSWATAKLTIQAAVKECRAGDIVTVDDGDYSDIGDSSTGSGYTMPTVVYIKTRIWLKSRNGKAKTFITGAYGDGTSPLDGSVKTFAGTGRGAVRCITSTAAADTVNGTLIEGFTIRNGSTVSDGEGNNNYDNAGGVQFNNGTAYLVDCDVLDCRAGCGAALARDVRPIRCRFAGNVANKKSQCFYRSSYAYNCLFENNGSSTASGCLFTYVQNTRAVNCTFVNNNVKQISIMNGGQKFTAYNCAFLDVNGAEAAAAQLTAENCVQRAKGSVMETAGVDCKTGVSAYQYFSPAEDDWKAVVGNDIVDKGKADYNTSEVAGVPAEYLTTDFLGCPRVSGAAIDIGCFETTEPKFRFCAFNLGAGVVMETAGRVCDPAGTVWGRWFGVGLPYGQVRLRTSLAGEIFGYTVTCEGAAAYTRRRFPDCGADKGFWLSPMTNGVTVVSVDAAASVKWVQGDYAGGDSDGSETKPFVTIPDAMAAATQKSVIKVRPGVYATGTDQGSIHVSGSDSGLCRVSIWRDLAVRSTDGAEKTVLKGGADVDSIVRPSNRTRNAQLQGFTLTGAVATESGKSAGAFFAAVNGSPETARDYSDTIHVTDCIITNNVSPGRVISGGWFERCLIADNFTTEANMGKGTGGARGTMAWGSILSGCVLDYSDVFFENGQGPAACTCASQNTTEMNCTYHIPGKDANGNLYRTINTGNGTTVAFNNALVGGGYVDALGSGVVVGGNVASPGVAKTWCTDLGDGTFFANAANRDYRPLSSSAGLSAGAEVPAEYLRYDVGDFHGKALAYRTGRAPIPGAYQELVLVVVPGTDNGRGTVTPSTVRMAAGDSQTFTATSTTHVFRGWVVDGVTNLTSEATVTYTASAETSARAVPLEALFSTDLYVDADDGDDDGNSGADADHPKKTLAAILANAVAGDTVHAAPGDYKDGTVDMNPGYDSSKYIYAYGGAVIPLPLARGVLPPGVALVADGDASDTFITGACDPAGEIFGDTKFTNCGTNSIRCLVAYADSYVRGFTIRNGSTRGKSGGPDDVNGGGGILAPHYENAKGRRGTVLVEDCVIRDCWARTGGNACGGLYNRCRLINGASGSGAGGCAASGARLENCLVDRSAMTSDNAIYNNRGIFNCTIYNLKTGGSQEFQNTSVDYPIVNSLICFQGTSGAVYELKGVRNCFIRFLGTAGKPSFDPETCTNNVFVGNWNDMMVGALGMPVPLPGSPVIDKGDAAGLAGMVDGTRDLLGNPRVYNRRVDCGCIEYDWRPDYAATLGGGRRLTVAEAGPEVAQTEDSVTVFDGELKAVWRSGGMPVEMGVDVRGNGTLTVWRGEEILGTYDRNTPEKKVRLDSTGAEETLRFAYARAEGDVEGAVLSGFVRNSGMSLIVR